MKIALIGYGAMGKLMAALSAARGYQIAVIINETHKDLSSDELADTLTAADVAIDFTAAKAVLRNVTACMMAQLPVVEGTTGWLDSKGQVEKLVNESDGALVFGANFSIGVNLFYRIVDRAAELIARCSEYEAFIEEQHHSRKKDAPSGTALKLSELIAKHGYRDIPFAVTRAGHIPGTHRVGFDGRADQITLEHSARSREGFASGALMAAEWIVGRKGFFEFSEVLDEIIDGTRHNRC